MSLVKIAAPNLQIRANLFEVDPDLKNVAPFVNVERIWLGIEPKLLDELREIENIAIKVAVSNTVTVEDVDSKVYRGMMDTCTAREKLADLSFKHDILRIIDVSTENGIESISKAHSLVLEAVRANLSELLVHILDDKSGVYGSFIIF